MSEAIGPVNHEGHRRSTFIETPFAPERGAYAEETARVIDAEVKRLITTAEDRARRILSERREVLDALSERLLEKEVIEGEELRQLLAAADDASGAPTRRSNSLRIASSADRIRCYTARSGAVPTTVLCQSTRAVLTSSSSHTCMQRETLAESRHVARHRRVRTALESPPAWLTAAAGTPDKRDRRRPARARPSAAVLADVLRRARRAGHRRFRRSVLRGKRARDDRARRLDHAVLQRRAAVPETDLLLLADRRDVHGRGRQRSRGARLVRCLRRRARARHVRRRPAMVRRRCRPPRRRDHRDELRRLLHGPSGAAGSCRSPSS